MTRTTDATRARAPRRPRDPATLFVLVREDRGSTDIRFIGAFLAAALHPLPDVLRQIMRRTPALIHLDLREVEAVDGNGATQLAHAVRICRRHGAMVKISVSSAVERAVEDARLDAVLGILPRDVREEMSAPRADGPTASSGTSPRY